MSPPRRADSPTGEDADRSDALAARFLTDLVAACPDAAPHRDDTDEGWARRALYAEGVGPDGEALTVWSDGDELTIGLGTVWHDHFGPAPGEDPLPHVAEAVACAVAILKGEAEVSHGWVRWEGRGSAVVEATPPVPREGHASADGLPPELAPYLGAGAQHGLALLHDGGDPWTAAEAAEHLGISPQAVSKRRAGGKLLGIRRGRPYLYPSWQFTDEGVLEGLPEVLEALEAEADPMTALQFFHGSVPDPDGGPERVTPLALLRAGRRHEVLAQALAGCGPTAPPDGAVGGGVRRRIDAPTVWIRGPGRGGSAGGRPPG